MSNLKDLVYGYEAGSTIKPAEFVIENTQTWVPHNGGCGYTWTVPAGIQHALFEVWSGGAGGGFSCCCTQGGAGGAGGYAMYEVEVTAGDSICMCSAGTSGSNMSCCQGFCGCASMICKSGTWCLCLTGGLYTARYPRCQLSTGCYTCCSMCGCCGGCSYVSGVTQLEHTPGNAGMYHSTQFCVEAGWQAAGVAHGHPGPRPQGSSTCCNSCFGGICGSYSSCCGQACMMAGFHPGGGGFAGWTNDGTCRCGGVGAGGMIYTIYW